MYQLQLTTLGVDGLAQGMAIAVHTPAFCGTPVNTLFRRRMLTLSVWR
jgi:hypothetical protein